ncbi:Na+-driven multidrug efflux pump [Paenibacillus sp. JGP012]|uniref:MATE family efflux transporter n=1 Tax=Paenibacillus sp. JGP012 TaxID=2735914 RepID=UPI00160C2913|nr:MATE family efflux transporter [Paenibacillus sp. JGP012]MBB6024645.1 Na+-driven multidrug efflux pump [Paenibacillus sp. JGP012]
MKGIDYTTGSIHRLLFRTAIPMLLASMVNVITQLANVFFLGHTNQSVLYVLSLYIPVSFVMISIIEAMQLSVQVAVARSRAGGPKAFTQLFMHMLGIALLLAVASGGMVLLLTPVLSWFYHVPADIEPMFTRYVAGMMAVSVPAVLAAVSSAALRGLGRAQAASLNAVGTAVLNIALVYTFVSILRMDLQGIIYANLITSVSSLALSLLVLLIRKETVKERFVFAKRHLITLRHVGIPVFFSYCMIFLSTFFFNKIVSYFGEGAVAGFGVGYRIQTMAILPGIVIGSAIGIIINHNLQAPHRERAYASYRQGLIHAFALYVVIAIVVWICRDPLVSFLIEDAATRAEAARYLSIVALSYIGMGPMMTTLLTMEQSGRGYQALLLNAVYFLIIIALGWVLTRTFNQVIYFYGVIAGMNVIGMCFFLPFMRLLKREYVGGAADQGRITEGEAELSQQGYSTQT